MISFIHPRWIARAILIPPVPAAVTLIAVKLRSANLHETWPTAAQAAMFAIGWTLGLLAVWSWWLTFHSAWCVKFEGNR